MQPQTIQVSTPVAPALIDFIAELNADKVFVLVDSNTRMHCWPLLEEALTRFTPVVIEVPSGEENKTIETTVSIWHELVVHGATRHSLMLNMGGGVITDMGGFAAATYKRGIRCINIPTTLLAAVDASVGGKTGIDFDGFKNEIGSFYPAVGVFVDTAFFKTLGEDNLISGYAEMLKHSLLESDSCWIQHLEFDFDELDYTLLNALVNDSIQIKRKVVEQDPYEKGLRKALNLGHTIGHAFESMALEKGFPVLHGYAVAWGMVCELYLSVRACGFPEEKLIRTTRFIIEHYGPFAFELSDYESLYLKMTHDKKNRGSEISFTLLADIGDVAIDQTLTKEWVFEAFDYLRAV